jgi:glycosyltransferase involved in cell wall biosynthesis
VSAPRLSILLPVRNAAATLPRCRASLVTQTFDDYEVVAVDDGSSDASGEMLESWARADPRVRVERTPPRGLVAALNLAAERACAPLVARMDADDVSRPERLAVQWARLQRGPATDILGARVCVAGDAAVTAGLRAYVDWQNSLLTHEAIVADLWVESPLVHPTVVMPRAMLRGLGGYRAFDGPEDYDLWLRAERAGARFAKVEQVLLEWWDSPGRLTRADERYRASRFFALKVESLCTRRLADAPSVVVWGAGPIGKRWGRALSARGVTIAAYVEVHPRRIGARLHGVPVVSVAELERRADIRAGLHLAAVGQPGRRAAIREAARRMGIASADLIAVA